GLLRRAARLHRLQPQRALVDRRHHVHPLGRSAHAQNPGLVRQRVGILESDPGPDRIRGSSEAGGAHGARMIRIVTLDDLPLPARVFYRVDYNVPLEGTRVSDATRIEETLPTLRRLRQAGCSVVIASHLGRPKGQRNPKYSLAPVRAKLAELLGAEVRW